MGPGVSCDEALLECVLGSDVPYLLWAPEYPLVRLQQHHPCGPALCRWSHVLGLNGLW